MVRKVGSDVDADHYWRERAADYATSIEGGYHRQRLDMIRRLLPDSADQTVDFGCGEGVLFQHLPGHIRGLDINAELLDQARQRIEASHLDAEVELGGVGALSHLADESVDLVVAANVLAYLRDEELEEFYRHAARILRPGGTMVVTHSNELFDLYTLNRYTVEFHDRHFGADVSSLVTHPEFPTRIPFNVRANPLSYRHVLASYGFEEVDQGFAHFHEAPPLLTGQGEVIDDRPYVDVTEWPESERWKLAFQCSIYGSRSQRRAA